MTADEQNDHDGHGVNAPGQVPDQAGAPIRESLAGRVPGQAPAGHGGVTPEAFVETGSPARDTAPAQVLVPAPAEPVDGERPPSDAELTALVRAGDDTAYEEIYRRHADSVRRYARTCCRDSFTAEDLAGEVFARTLQALRAGKGPEFAVRAYLLTAVRNVAAAWARSDRREQLVADFGAFAQTSAATIDLDLADPGADAWAMALADQRMVMQAFVELPEDDRVVLWHTEVERESPKTVAVLIGKTANATAVQAHRARDRLAAAFLQAHVSGSQEQGCAAYANRLGAYARGSLRKRASAEVGKHVQGCDRCAAAYLELTDINHSLRVILPGGVLIWVGAGYFAAAAAAVGAGAVGATAVVGAATGGATTAGGATAGGATAGATAAGGTAAGGTAAGGTAAGGTAGSGGGSAGAVAGEGLGTAAKASIAAGLAVAAAAAAAYALAGSPEVRPPVAAPPVSSPVLPPPVSEPAQKPTPSETPTPSPTPTPEPPRPRSAPSRTPSPTQTVVETPAPPAPPVVEPPAPPTPPVVPTPTPPALPTDFWIDDLPFSNDSYRVSPSGPTIRRDDEWVWQRDGLWMAGDHYQHGLSVHAPTAVTIDLNRGCSSFRAVAGLDDLSLQIGNVVFSVQGGDGSTLWRSGRVGRGDAPVPVRVPLNGQRSIRLVVTPVADSWSLVNVADWADARFSCT